MFFLFGTFDKGIDDISQHMKGFINITALFQPLSLHICMFDSLTTCQIDYIDFGSSELDGVILEYFRLDIKGEDGVWSWALFVHASFCYFPIFLAL